MPHPALNRAVSIAHRTFFSGDNADSTQVFSGDARVLNPNGDNPAVVKVSSQKKVLLELETTALAYEITVFGRGQRSSLGDEIDTLCVVDRKWQLSFDGGLTKLDFTPLGAIAPDPSNSCWRFTLVKSDG